MWIECSAFLHPDLLVYLCALFVYDLYLYLYPTFSVSLCLCLSLCLALSSRPHPFRTLPHRYTQFEGLQQQLVDLIDDNNDYLGVLTKIVGMYEQRVFRKVHA